MAREAGKGSGRRQAHVPDEVVGSNWELAFGKKNTANSSFMKEEPLPDPNAKVEEIFDPYLTVNS